MSVHRVFVVIIPVSAMMLALSAFLSTPATSIIRSIIFFYLPTVLLGATTVVAIIVAATAASMTIMISVTTPAVNRYIFVLLARLSMTTVVG
jgi:hypothetical protein